MSNNSSDNDPKNLWQAQEAEELTMSPTEMRDRLLQFRRRGRIGNLMIAIVIGAIAIGYGIEAVSASEPLRRAGYLMMTLGTLYWSVLSFIRAASRPATIIPPTPSLDIYRNTLERSIQRLRSQNRHILLGAIPVVVGIVIVLLFPGRQQPAPTVALRSLNELLLRSGVPSWMARWLPFLVLLGLWGFLMAYLRMCSTAWLRSELQRVDRMRDQ